MCVCALGVCCMGDCFVVVVALAHISVVFVDGVHDDDDGDIAVVIGSFSPFTFARTRIHNFCIRCLTCLSFVMHCII